MVKKVKAPKGQTPEAGPKKHRASPPGKVAKKKK